MIGSIKKLKVEQGFGFIKLADGSPDVFFHFTGVDGGIDAYNELQEGQQVEFTMGEGRGGKPLATDVRVSETEAA